MSEDDFELGFVAFVVVVLFFGSVYALSQSANVASVVATKIEASRGCK